MLLQIVLASNPDWTPPTWNHLMPQYMNYDVQRTPVVAPHNLYTEHICGAGKIICWTQANFDAWIQYTLSQYSDYNYLNKVIISHSNPYTLDDGNRTRQKTLITEQRAIC